MHSAAAREADFWDRAAAGVAEADAEDAVAALMGRRSFRAVVQCLGELRGSTVLDVCCGTGASTTALALLGAARVVGVDVSTASLEVAHRLAQRHGCSGRTSFVAASAEVARPDWRGAFHALFGMYALHHLNLPEALPALSDYLVPGGRAAFLETSALNPVLRCCRSHLAGRVGIPRFGTADEHPLRRADLELCAETFGSVDVRTREVFNCFGVLDRQVLRYRIPLASRACRAADRALARVWPAGSYHVIVACRKTTAPRSRPFAAGG